MERCRLGDLARASSLSALCAASRHAFPRDLLSRFFTEERKKGRNFFLSSRSASPHFLLRRRAQRTLQDSLRREERRNFSVPHFVTVNSFVQLRLRSRSPERNGGEAPWTDQENFFPSFFLL
jgi:hypothetical protein